MNLRHAAALVLVGWYLMVPPTEEIIDPACRWDYGETFFGRMDKLLNFGSNANDVRCLLETLSVDTNAPLSEWSSFDAFETLGECKAERGKPLTDSKKLSLEKDAREVFDAHRASLPNDFVDKSVASVEESIRLEQCIATDDPRLKGN